jgi:hypothetical protein
MDKEERMAAIEEIAKVLKQVLSVDPQLLFEALKKVGSGAIVEGLQAGAAGASDKKLRSIARRGALCLAMSQELLASGSAIMSAADIASARDFVSWLEGSDHAQEN